MVRRVTQAGLQPHPAQRINRDVSAKVSHKTVSAGGQNGQNSGEKVSDLFPTQQSFFCFAQNVRWLRKISTN
jgi:hypothetical protein